MIIGFLDDPFLAWYYSLMLVNFSIMISNLRSREENWDNNESIFGGYPWKLRIFSIWWTKRINHVRQSVHDLRCPLTLLPSNLVRILCQMIFFSLSFGVLSRNCPCLSFATRIQFPRWGRRKIDILLSRRTTVLRKRGSRIWLREWLKCFVVDSPSALVVCEYQSPRWRWRRIDIFPCRTQLRKQWRRIWFWRCYCITGIIRCIFKIGCFLLSSAGIWWNVPATPS